MHHLEVIEPNPAPLCQTRTQSCVACCRGKKLSDASLIVKLRRQTERFQKSFGSPNYPPSFLARILFELRSRRFSPLLFAPLFLLPGFGPLIRTRFANRSCCAFLGYLDGSRAGCLLHPTRMGGTDVRRRTAFALLPGMRCGEPGFTCNATHLYRRLGLHARQEFKDKTQGMASTEYSRAVEELEVTASRPPA